MMGDAPPLLELDDARVVRDGRVILHVDSLAIDEFEALAILGPNGAGKSTLVGLLTADVKPLWTERGAVRFRGDRLWDVARARREIGVVSHAMQETLERDITALDAVVGGRFGAVGVPPHIRPGRADRDAALHALERLGAAHLASRRVWTLSTGEARRVVIARAMAADPAVLVLDEPTAGLDPGAAFEVREAVGGLLEQRVTVLLVTHHIEDIDPRVDRVLLLAGGRVTADGPAAELIESDRLSALFGVPLAVAHDERGWRLA